MELGASGRFVVLIKVNHSGCFSVTFSDTLVCPGGGGPAGRAGLQTSPVPGLPPVSWEAPDPTPPSARQEENSETKPRSGTGFLDLCGRSLVGKPRGKNSRLQELGLGGSRGPLNWLDSCRCRNPWVRVLGSGWPQGLLSPQSRAAGTQRSQGPVLDRAPPLACGPGRPWVWPGTRGALSWAGLRGRGYAGRGSAGRSSRGRGRGRG